MGYVYLMMSVLKRQRRPSDICFRFVNKKASGEISGETGEWMSRKDEMR